MVLETLESLWQEGAFPELECLIIDDGSTDRTLTTLTAWVDQKLKPGMLLISQKNQGLSAVRNLGASLARGEWLAFLDSDDWVTKEGLLALWSLAKVTTADMLLGGVRLVDGGRESVPRPFYHDRVWQRLLGSAKGLETSSGASPSLLSLEPNINYRWFRRRFYQAAALHFPEGLLFEDLPVHFRALRSAGAIALIETPYYHYRVNRPGKITESRDVRRFDALKTLKLALDELPSASLSPAEGGYAMRSMARLGWGCGRMTPKSMRLAYFRALSELLAQIPLRWRLQSLLLPPLEKPLLGLLMLLGQPLLLALVSLLARPRWGYGRGEGPAC